MKAETQQGGGGEPGGKRNGGNIRGISGKRRTGEKRRRSRSAKQEEQKERKCRKESPGGSSTTSTFSSRPKPKITHTCYIIKTSFIPPPSSGGLAKCPMTPGNPPPPRPPPRPLPSLQSMRQACKCHGIHPWRGEGGGGRGGREVWNSRRYGAVAASARDERIVAFFPPPRLRPR